MAPVSSYNNNAKIDAIPLGWHYDWHYDGHEHMSPTSFESEDDAIYWAQHLCEKMDIVDNTETVWKSEK